LPPRPARPPLPPAANASGRPAENKLRSYIPIGAAADPTSQGAGGTWAWFIDATRNRVVYCAAASFQTPPECRDGIIP